MRYVIGLFIASVFLLSSACTNAVPVTTMSSSSDLAAGRGPSANLSVSAGELQGSNFKLKYRMGKTVSESEVSSASYKIKLKGSDIQ